MAAWSSDINFKGFEDYDTSFTVTTTDSCYTWNSQTYCASGDYTQTLQTIHGCDSVVTLHLTITVGVDNYDGFDFKVYPNPTSNIVNVECIMKNEEWGEVEFVLNGIYLTLFCAKKQKRNGRQKTKKDEKESHSRVQAGSFELLLRSRRAPT